MIKFKSMAEKENIHVVPNPEGGWDTKRENAKRASNHFEKKSDAVEAKTVSLYFYCAVFLPK